MRHDYSIILPCSSLFSIHKRRCPYYVTINTVCTRDIISDAYTPLLGLASPTLAVSDGMYERHPCTEGERQNAAPMVCTSGR